MRFLLLTLFTFSAFAFDSSHEQWGQFLKQHVVNGRVDYQNAKNSSELLDSYLKELTLVKLDQFNQWSNEHQIAFLVNSYNAHTINMVLRYYPIKSVKEIGGLFKFLPGLTIWDKNFISLFGQKMSLNTIEHKYLRKNYNEPRIHFALNCAALGSPKLRNEPYMGDKLSAQLEEQQKIFFREENEFNNETKQLRLSSIFKWYESDFTKESSKDLKTYLSELAGKSLLDFDIEYSEYNWNLNNIEADK